MRNGFYMMQESYLDDMKGFLEKLDSIETKLPVLIDECECATVAVGSFLQGFCMHLALRFSDVYGLDIGILRDGDDMVHVFNTYTSPDGRLCYLDARGITDDMDLFLKPFFVTDPYFSGPFKRQDIMSLSKEEAWYFFEDEISEAMIDWLLYTFSDIFKPALSWRNANLSLNELVEEIEYVENISLDEKIKFEKERYRDDRKKIKKHSMKELCL